MDHPPDPLAWIDDALERLSARDLRRAVRTYKGPQQAVIRAGDGELVNFGSNDYLGLAADPRLAAAAAEAAFAQGCGSGASPLVTGHITAHEQLEQSLAEFEQAEAALLFPSGYAANQGVITALVGRGDTIYADAKNHASMIDGCRLSRAEIRIYPHGDATALAAILAEDRTSRRRLIATESVFSMDGDLAPLARLAQLAEAHGAMLLVDEAHATGVFGAQGRGLAEQLGVEDQVHVRVGTLSKALGCAGGFVCGSRRLIDWLANAARPYVFSTALAPPLAAAAATALRIVQGEPERRGELLAQSTELRHELTRRGWSIGTSASQIVPLVAGDPATALGWAEQLRLQGLLVPAIRPPSVPPGQSLLRISLSWSHTPAMIARLVAALETLTPTGQRASRALVGRS